MNITITRHINKNIIIRNDNNNTNVATNTYACNNIIGNYWKLLETKEYSLVNATRKYDGNKRKFIILS